MPSATPIARHATGVAASTINGVIEDATTLSAFTRWRRAFRALAQVMADPEKTDQVLVFSIYANAGSMPNRIHRFLDSPEGRRLYEEHRTIDSRTVDLDALLALPEGTLGHAYAHFLRSRGLTPTVFDNPPTEVSDPRMQYVVQRLRQTHDLWHVVTGHDTNPASEIALQAFTFAQVRAPSSAILAMAGMLRAKLAMPREPIARSVLRSMMLGLRANPLPVFPWEDHWSTPLVEVRETLGIPRDGIRMAMGA
jgi:ubiquinone biosynthesis protein Coq4